MTRRRRVPSLQVRLALIFACGTLALSALLSVIAYFSSREYLLGELKTVASRQTFDNARLVRDGLLPGNVDITTLLTSVGGPTGSDSVVEYRHRWYASSLAKGRAVLPTVLVDRVLGGHPARQRVALPGGPALVIGVPLPEVHGAYFGLFSLTSLAGTLHAIAVGLLVAAAATTGGGALLGYWTSRRLVRPILEVARASSRIAEGQLETRLSVASDRELATLSRSFNEMADALQRRIQRDSRFVADVTHELRSPLTTLAVTLSILETRRGSLPPRSQQALDLLAEGLHRFQRLVDDLLEIGRLELTAPDPMLEPVRIAELVERVCREQLPAGVPVHLAGEVAPLVVRGDKRRLERVLANLFDNAARHAGGVTGVWVQARGAEVRISVEDAGPGVPVADRERIFDRFARVSPARDRTDGAGLGLALAREHVNAHFGQVWAEAREGGGARFVVTLPTGDA